MKLNIIVVMTIWLPRVSLQVCRDIRPTGTKCGGGEHPDQGKQEGSSAR